MDETLVWRSPGQSTQRNRQRPQGLVPRAVMARHQCGTAVAPSDVVSAASSPNEIEAQILPSVVSILRSSRAFSLWERRSMDSAVTAVAPKRYPKKAISMPKLYLEHTLSEAVSGRTAVWSKANSYTHFSDDTVTSAD